jgi:hypothetical protein
MKRYARSFFLFSLIAIIAAGCGGGGASSITGPILSIGEIESLMLDQFFMNGGMADEYGDHGEFSVYLRDAATGEDVACTRLEDGMSKLTAAGVYYAGLGVPLREAEGEHATSVVRFKLLFVEKDGEACPAPIGAEDDIAGESAELTFDQLIGGRIWATNGLAAAVLRISSDVPLSVPSMAPSINDGLSIDKLSFEDNSGEEARYYLFAEKIEDGQSVYQCQIADDAMGKIRAGGVLHAALGFPFDCFDPSDPDFSTTRVRVGLYVQGDAGPELVGQTAPTAIGDLIGERSDFTDGNGYVTFQPVSTALFGAQVVRLADFGVTELTRFAFDENPTSDAPLEVFAVDASNGVAMACAGAPQGLTGVSAPGTYEGLVVDFMPMEGQTELFGSDDVILKLVERTDGRACPQTAGANIPVVAETAALLPTDLDGGEASFEGGGGMEFVRKSGS